MVRDKFREKAWNRDRKVSQMQERLTSDLTWNAVSPFSAVMDISESVEDLAVVDK